MALPAQVRGSSRRLTSPVMPSSSLSLCGPACSGMTVSLYQWRAPGEWFAELYAFTHVQQRKAPSSVDAEVAGYMFQGP